MLNSATCSPPTYAVIAAPGGSVGLGSRRASMRRLRRLRATASAAAPGAPSASSMPRHRRGDAGERRRVAQRVEAGLRLAQLHHEVEEVAGLVRLERDDELLVVEPERIRRVELHGRILAADADVRVHHRLALLLREVVPGPRLHERVDEEILRRARRDPQPPRRGRRLALVDVHALARHREVRSTAS